MRNKQKPTGIVVFGHFGAGNFGNEGTLQAMLYNLRRLNPEAELSCICTVPERVAADYQISARLISETVVGPWRWRNPVVRWVRKLLIGVPSEAYRWFKAFTMLSHTDVFIVPGTGLLTDAYSLLGWGPYSTFKWCVIAKLCRCKLLFVSVGAGPLYSRRGRFFIKTALNLADFRSYRDASTQRYLESIGFRTTHDNVFPDLAFSLPEWHFNSSQSARRPIVGIGLMEYAGRYSVEKPTNAVPSAYMENLVAFGEWLLEHGYDLRLLIGDLVDTGVKREFKSLLMRSGAYGKERIIEGTIESTEELLSQLEATDFIVATRFHNVLLSLLLNKPTIAISFHHKCSSLMSQMGLTEYCLDINHLQADVLINQFRRLEENATILKATIAEKVKGCRDALDEQYAVILRKMFPEKGRATMPVSAMEVRPGSTSHMRS